MNGRGLFSTKVFRQCDQQLSSRRRLSLVCRKKNIEQSFRFPGWVPYDQMPEYTRLADIAIIASEAEGMSRAYLEAMACQCVLVASDIPPAEELVDDGVTGLLFRMGDVRHLAARTLEAAADPVIRDVVGRRARKSVLPRSIDNAVNAYLQEFERVLGRRTASPFRATS